MQLPSDTQLREMYTACREAHFRLPRGYAIPPANEVCIEWSTRLTASAGVCYPSRRLIRLSVHYHGRHLDDVRATLLHEMIHLVVPGHGAEFHRWLKHIRTGGGRVFRHSKERAAPAKWIYICRGCKRQIHRQRRLKDGGKHHCCRTCGPKKGRLIETRPGVRSPDTDRQPETNVRK